MRKNAQKDRSLGTGELGRCGRTRGFVATQVVERGTVLTEEGGGRLNSANRDGLPPAVRCHHLECVEDGEKREVRRSEVQGPEFLRREPAQRDVLVGVGSRAMRCEAAEERQHMNHDGAVIVFIGREHTEVDELAAELLADLAKEGGSRFFILLHFAAGDFPFQAEVFVRRSLRDENAAGGVEDESADYGKRWHGESKWSAFGSSRLAQANAS